MNPTTWFSKLKSTKNPFFLEILFIVFTGAMAAVLALWTFRESPRQIFSDRIPLAGDGLLTGLYLRTASHTSLWDLFTQNVHSFFLGWPGELNFSSYPVGNTGELLLIRFFTSITGIDNPSVLIHIFSILKSVPIAISVYMLARILKIPRVFAVVSGITFSLNTFNLIRAEGHFFLALTWSLPLGLAAIYIAFRSSYVREEFKRQNLILVLVLSGMAFLTGYYYTFFLIIFSLSMILFLLFRSLMERTSSNLISQIRECINETRILLLVFAIFCGGFLIQILPLLLKSSSDIKLVALGDRSPIEAIIYAGTPESLFYDLHVYLLKFLGRPDLTAFLQTRISWEGSQVGAFSGLVLILLLAYITFSGLSRIIHVQSFSPKVSQKLSPETAFISLILGTSLLLYFVSPLNFSISRILPQIRAWGRLSVVISLLTILLFALFATKVSINRNIKFVLLILFIAIPAMEVNQFHGNRPTSAALNAASLVDNVSTTQTVNQMRSIYSERCPISLLPVYPFPEFDRPDDSNIDYGLARLPLSDDSYFRWSYAGIKASKNFSSWQPLVSEFPPFARAGIKFQIDYSHALGVCGVVIDRSYLNSSEKAELSTILELKTYSCEQDLIGEKFENLFRYVTINFRGEKCSPKLDKTTVKYATSNAGKSFLWRIDQGGSTYFLERWQMFGAETPISLRLNIGNQESGGKLEFIFRFTGNESLLEKREFSICLLSNELELNQCKKIRISSAGIGRLPVPQQLYSSGLKKIIVSIDAAQSLDSLNWGITVEKEN